MSRALISLALACCAGASGAFAEIQQMATDKLTSLRFGIYCTGPTVGQTDAPATISGFVDTVQESRLVLPVSRVPAELGLTFGVEFQGQPGVFGPVVLTTHHPAMGAEGATQQTWVSSIADDGEVSVFYTFDFPFEQKPGPWVMEAEYEGQLIYRVAFDVVPEGMAPAGDCAPTPLLSGLPQGAQLTLARVGHPQGPGYGE